MQEVKVQQAADASYSLTKSSTKYSLNAGNATSFTFAYTQSYDANITATNTISSSDRTLISLPDGSYTGELSCWSDLAKNNVYHSDTYDFNDASVWEANFTSTPTVSSSSSSSSSTSDESKGVNIQLGICAAFGALLISF